MRVGRILILLLLVVATPVRGEGGKERLPNPFGREAVAYLLRVDGRDLWGRNADKRLAPASLTKMMTALLVLERTLPAEITTVSRPAALETGSRLGLRPGSRVTVGELLAASLLASANDACHALADHVAGSEQGFVALMNERATGLGLTATRFANACGHDAPGLYSTARDLARLAEAALRQPLFAKLTALTAGAITTADQGERFELANTNALLGRFPGAMGVKTGFTPQAGKCLVALAEQEGKRVLLVLLNSPDRWWLADRMLTAAFAEGRAGVGAADPRP